MMKNEFSQLNLFALPIYKIKIDPTSYDKEKIINDILYNKNLKNTRNDPHQKIGKDISNIHHSYKDSNNEDFRSIDYKKLIVVYTEIFNKFLSKEIKYIPWCDNLAEETYEIKDELIEINKNVNYYEGYEKSKKEDIEFLDSKRIK